MEWLSLNYNVEPRKYLEILRGSDTVIVLYSDDGTTIFKETHTFSLASSGPQSGFVKSGMSIESITVEQATGSWDDRYTLEYGNSDSTSDETNIPEDEDSTGGNDFPNAEYTPGTE